MARAARLRMSHTAQERISSQNKNRAMRARKFIRCREHAAARSVPLITPAGTVSEVYARGKTGVNQNREFSIDYSR
jgi:hypothetical protein